jgi:protein involved in polysaccharide export with SLBB domain
MKVLHRKILVNIALLFFAATNPAHPDAEFESQRRASQAMATINYHVSPGDVYILSYLRGGEVASISAVVQVDMTVNFRLFGVRDVTNIRFVDLRTELEDQIRRATPTSVPSLTIQRLGEFPVLIRGEVTMSQPIMVDGLTRLSDVLEERTTLIASRRTVRIENPPGSIREFDLFRAEREGILEHNPMLRPGDVITVGRASRLVEIVGHVQRPGTYELLPDDDLSTLIQTYADGYTLEADPDRTTIRSIAHGVGVDVPESRVRIVSNEEPIPLQNGDVIRVPSGIQFLPAVLFQGAVRNRSDTTFSINSEEAEPLPVSIQNDEGYGELLVRFSSGELLSEVVQRISGDFLPEADLENALLIEGRNSSSSLSINIKQLMQSRDSEYDRTLNDGDRIIIPFSQRFVVVSGAVRNTGRFPYIPGRSYQYYLALAGGVNPSQRWGIRPSVFDREGNRKSRREPLQPEDRLHFSTNSPFFFIAPVATVLSVIASIISLTQ